MDDSLSNSSKKRNKLGYHRTSVACVHCRKRKIRCLVAANERRCENCIRLKKQCDFCPVDQQPPAPDKRRVPSRTASRAADARTVDVRSETIGSGPSESVSSSSIPSPPPPPPPPQQQQQQQQPVAPAGTQGDSGFQYQPLPLSSSDMALYEPNAYAGSVPQFTPDLDPSAHTASEFGVPSSIDAAVAWNNPFLPKDQLSDTTIQPDLACAATSTSDRYWSQEPPAISPLVPAPQPSVVPSTTEPVFAIHPGQPPWPEQPVISRAMSLAAIPAVDPSPFPTTFTPEPHQPSPPGRRMTAPPAEVFAPAPPPMATELPSGSMVSYDASAYPLWNSFSAPIDMASASASAPGSHVDAGPAPEVLGGWYSASQPGPYGQVVPSDQSQTTP